MVVDAKIYVFVSVACRSRTIASSIVELPSNCPRCSIGRWIGLVIGIVVE